MEKNYIYSIDLFKIKFIYFFRRVDYIQEVYIGIVFSFVL